MKAGLKQGTCVQQAGGGGVRHELRLAPPPPGTGAEGVTAEGQAATRAELPQHGAAERRGESITRDGPGPQCASSSLRPLLQGWSETAAFGGKHQRAVQHLISKEMSARYDTELRNLL
ncbi:hypothetical protein MDA_GLEAN10016532 [Myotis davidii]|uniref:Uncharacterized protein n=1 Tax=Myotis davidii TaxID=225400 RepID=L5LQA5_MYODS|nr:hypothetical protein MDA_GLEAN10016532 [Myotis davidii]